MKASSIAAIEIDPLLAQLLVDANFLPLWHADNPKHVRAAFEHRTGILVTCLNLV